MRKRIDPLLEQISQIKKMERGKICAMSCKKYFNHQTWLAGKNVVKYVPASRVAELQEAIDGYNLCQKLIEQYIDKVVQRTREQMERKNETRQRRK